MWTVSVMGQSLLRQVMLYGSVDFKSGDPGAADIHLVPSGAWAFPGGAGYRVGWPPHQEDPVSGFAVGGAQGKAHVWPLGAQGSSWLTASKETELQA